LDLENGLEKVLQLQGVSYQWKDAERFGDQVEIGFIAQDVDEIVPEVVRKGGDYWSLNTRNLLAVVVEAIKEIWATVTGNTDRITELEERIINLEAAAGNASAKQVVGQEDQEDEEDTEENKVIIVPKNDVVMVRIATTTSTSSSIFKETAKATNTEETIVEEPVLETENVLQTTATST
jgi:hypothetical protein